MLFLRGLKDVVIFILPADRNKVAEPVAADVVEGLLEQEKLKLGRHHRREPHGLSACDLRLQDLARRMGDRFVGVM